MPERPPAGLFDKFVAHPDRVEGPSSTGECKAWCPWHDDRSSKKPSLGFNVKTFYVKCWSGCRGGWKALAKAWDIPIDKEDRRSRRAPPAAMTPAAGIQALKDAYGLTDEAIAEFGIEAKPEMVKPDKSSRGVWSYPVPGGVRYKAFDRKAPNKVWWRRGGDNQARTGVLYGADHLPDDATEVYFVNGEPSVWVCWQAGLPAVCAYGEGNFTPIQAASLKAAGIKGVRIVLDLDDAGVRACRKALELLDEVGMTVTNLQLPTDLGQKADIADLFKWHKWDRPAFAIHAARLPERALPSTDPLIDTRYKNYKGRYWFVQPGKDGDTDIQLANFTAQIESEVVEDDGTDNVLTLSLSGKMDSGHRFPEVRVASAKAGAMNWVSDQWGASAILKAGPGTGSQVWEIIQRESLHRGYERRVIYKHTGWRQINDRWNFLMPGKIVGPDRAEVELARSHERYKFIDSSDPLLNSLRSSLRFLGAADRRVTIPMLIYAYLAPLQSIMQTSFTLWLNAQSGSFKSTLAALLLCHFGEFTYSTPPATWEGTPRGIERILYDLKDLLVWVDDFAPKATEREMTQLSGKADQGLRSMGNLAGRARMMANTQLQDTYVPRGLLITTGELLPRGLSIMARLFALDFGRADVNVDEMSWCQQETDRYPAAMAAYIDWLRPQMPTLETDLPSKVADYRSALSGNVEHARIPAAIATMQTGAELFAAHLVHRGLWSELQSDEFRSEARDVLLYHAKRLGDRIQERDPVERYFGVIETLLAQRKVGLIEKGMENTLPPHQELIGWYDDDEVYLDHRAAFRRAAEFARSGGTGMAIDESALLRSMDERNLISKKEKDRLTTRVTVNGHRQTVVILNREGLSFSSPKSTTNSLASAELNGPGWSV